MFEIILLAQAEDEMAEAYDWYKEQLSGLGNRFYKETNHHLTLIEKNPLWFPIRYAEGLRELPVKKFPFLIIYWTDETTSVVYVTSIFHTSRDPQF